MVNRRARSELFDGSAQRFVEGLPRNRVGEPILRADHHLRGVVLPPGKHRVVFDFDPIENRIGAGISLLTAIAVAAAIALGRRRNAGSAGPVA